MNLRFLALGLLGLVATSAGAAAQDAANGEEVFKVCRGGNHR